MNEHSLASDLASEAAKGAPPVAVAGTYIVGIVDWQTWVLILTAIYVLMQIGWLGWRFVDKAMGKKTDG